MSKIRKNKTFTIPKNSNDLVKDKSKKENNNKESIVRLIEEYHEEIYWDDNTAEVQTNGSKQIPFTKEIWLPS